MKREVEDRLRSAPEGSKAAWCLRCGRVFLSTPTEHGRPKYESAVLDHGNNPACGNTIADGTPAECLSAFAQLQST